MGVVDICAPERRTQAVAPMKHEKNCKMSGGDYHCEKKKAKKEVGNTRSMQIETWMPGMKGKGDKINAKLCIRLCKRKLLVGTTER